MKKLIGIIAFLALCGIKNELVGLTVMSLLVAVGFIVFITYCERRKHDV